MISDRAPTSPWLLALQRATHAVSNQLASTLADLDLSPAEINVLANLGTARGQSISQLAAAVGARPSTLTSLLDRLERRGFVTRHQHPADRRSIVIELSDTGRPVVARISRAIKDLEHRLIDDLPHDVVVAFRVVLDALSGAQS